MKKISYYLPNGYNESNEFFCYSDQTAFKDLPFFAAMHKFFLQHGYEIASCKIHEPMTSDVVILDPLSITKVTGAFLNLLLQNNRLNSCVYLANECGLIEPFHNKKTLLNICEMFGAVLTWNDDMMLLKNVFNSYFRCPNLLNHTVETVSHPKKLLTNISGNKEFHAKGYTELYSQRIQFIRFMEENHPQEFDLYGRGWNKTEYPSYCGEVENKHDVLQKYKFSVCFENCSNIKGYITEKIWDCLLCGVIPIYWGAENITQYVPKSCFIDYRDFMDFNHVYEYIDSMSFERYAEYITNINSFLNSNQYVKANRLFYYESLLQAVRYTEMNVSLPRTIVQKGICLLHKYSFQRQLKLERH